MKKRKLDIYGDLYTYKYAKMPEEECGECDAEARIITIDKSLKGDDLKQTILHEEIHAIFARIGLRQAVDLEVEEIIAESISTFVIENYRMIPKKP